MSQNRDQQAFSLVECLIYLGVLTVVMTLATPLFWESLKGASDLRRNADDIERVLRVGERWRDDVRSATAAPRFVGSTLYIPHGTNEVLYWFANGVVKRDRVAVLGNVRVSRMQVDQRQQVESWCWELELASSNKTVRVRPLFSFETVVRGKS